MSINLRTIRFSCSACGKGYRVSQESANAVFNCKQCGEPLRVPTPQPSEQEPPISASAVKANEPTPREKPARTRTGTARWRELSYSYLWMGLILAFKGAWICHYGLWMDTTVGEVYNTGLLSQQQLFITLGSGITIVATLILLGGASLMVASTLSCNQDDGFSQRSVAITLIAGVAVAFLGSYLLVPVAIGTLTANTIICLNQKG